MRPHRPIGYPGWQTPPGLTLGIDLAIDVARHGMNVERSAVTSASRTERVSHVRAVAMWLLVYAGHRDDRVAAAFGRERSTAAKATKWVQDRIEKPEIDQHQVKAWVLDCLKRLEASRKPKKDDMSTNSEIAAQVMSAERTYLVDSKTGEQLAKPIPTTPGGATCGTPEAVEDWRVKGSRAITEAVARQQMPREQTQKPKRRNADAAGRADVSETMRARLIAEYREKAAEANHCLKQISRLEIEFNLPHWEPGL